MITLNIVSEKNELQASISFGTQLLPKLFTLRLTKMSQIQSSFTSKGGQPKICSPRNTMLYCYTLQFLLHHSKDKFLNIKLKKKNKKKYPVQCISKLWQDKALILPNLLQYRYQVGTRTTELLILSKYRWTGRVLANWCHLLRNISEEISIPSSTNQNLQFNRIWGFISELIKPDLADLKMVENDKQRAKTELESKCEDNKILKN